MRETVLVGGTCENRRSTANDHAKASALYRAGAFAPILAVAGVALCLSIIGLGPGLLLLGIAAILGLFAVLGHYGLRSAPGPTGLRNDAPATCRPVHVPPASPHHN